MSSPNEAEQRSHGLLIVDDEPAIRESLELTLGGEYRTFTASSGEEGLTVLAREDIACVIADQVMPGMSGVEFLEQVRQLFACDAWLQESAEGPGARPVGLGDQDSDSMRIEL